MKREKITERIAKRLIALMLMMMLVMPIPAFAEGEADGAADTMDAVTETAVDESADDQGGAAVETPDAEGTDEVSGEEQSTEPAAEEAAEEIPEEELIEEEVLEEEIIPEPVERAKISSSTISSPKQIKKSDKAINLRTMVGEESDGCAVVQGSCTDGKYAYYMMVSAATQKGRLLKVRMSDNKVMGKSAIVDVNHGNGICYDSKRNLIVSATYHDSRQRLAFFDADSLAFNGFKNVKFSYYKNAGSDSINSEDRKRGLTAVAYNATYDVYVGMESGYHDIIIYDAKSLEAIGKARTTVNAAYPAVWQSMDCDDRYVYYVLSPGTDQPNTVILCLEWHSEYLQQVRVEGKKCVEKAWTCGSAATEAKRTGKPSAVKKVKMPYEAESVYHIFDPATGKAHFYMSAYRGVNKYEWVKKTTTKKVKWKKVKKKVKWKKVNGKWKYKTKKVWKYKTKKVTKKVWTCTGKTRYGYVYDLGVF